MTHPLCRWLTGIHERRGGMTDDRLRVLVERALLHRHRADGRYSPVCGYDSEPFPCFEWRTIAAGWARVDGYDPAWAPTTQPSIDLDWLTAKEET